ncbi:MAG: glycosyltransferase family 4 protein [Verrucomicrobiota bacterium]|nr:glycosyltransferase family 4 protein [Verrucomicrobiota bacterium]
MNEETAIILPELTGGVGDYTNRLLENLPRFADLRLIIPKTGIRPANSFERYPVVETERTTQDLRARLPARGGRVLVQYSAYGFDRFGYPRWLIKALLDWKKESRGTLAIMFHEIWAFWPVWNKNYFVQRLHRRDLRKLLRAADAVFTSTTSQAEYLTALSPACAIEVLPVGSNIRSVAAPVGEREPGLAVLFGLQRSRIRALRKMHEELKSLAASGRIRKIVTAGSGRSAEGDEEELALLLGLELSDGFDQRGPLPGEKISELLSAAMFAISAQDELSVTKSGTFMAAAAHGLNILSNYADTSKPEPLSLLTSPRELINGLTDTELQSRGEKLRQWQERTSAWPLITERFARALTT